MATEHHHTAKHHKPTANGVDQLIERLEPYFTTKAPYQIPENGRKAIVEYAWIISLVLGVLLVPTVFALLGVMGVVGTFATAVGVVVGPLYWLAGLALVVQTVFLFIAIPGLKNRSYAKGWKIVFYSQLFAAANSILHISASSLVMGALGLVIGLFVLFQVKSYYR